MEGIWPDLDTVDLFFRPTPSRCHITGRLKIRSEGEASNMAYVMPKDAKLFSYCGGVACCSLGTQKPRSDRIFIAGH